MNTLIPGAPLRSLSPTSNEYQRAEGVSRAANPARVARFTLDAPEHSGTIPGARGDILTPGVALTSNLAVIFTLNQHTPKSLSRHDGASVIRACRQRCEELVAETLVVPFCVIVHYVFGYRCAQVSLTERYEAVETLSTYGENESFRICIQIRTISGKAKGVHRHY